MAEGPEPSRVLDYQSPSSILDPPPSRLAWLGWAVYLGMSWTWCIGMFLPVLLIRDYGAWAWVVFAVPNVIGAAAMGWIVRSAEQSQRLALSHAQACRWFSLVTVAFQVTFIGWWLHRVEPRALHVLLLLVLLSIFARGHRWIRLASIAALLVSLSCLVPGLVTSVLPVTAPPQPATMELLPLAAVCLLGFLLCPYLDLTFHRARQAAQNEAHAKLAFSIGFGFFFLLMILFTLAYSGIGTTPINGILAWVLTIHVAVQLAITIALHISEVESRLDFTWDTLAAAFIAMLLAVSSMRLFELYGMTIGELIYRLFMSFYGLVFPAYVWLCMIPGWRRPLAPSPRQWLVFGMAVIVAAPFYWIAFIQGHMMWVVPGVLLVLAARLALPKRVVPA